jgi:site-specific DNA-methyltransferase (adenine-specific)
MTNKIYYGDNLDILRHQIATESVDLCYIDPPFNSKRNYNQIYNNIGTEKEDKAQAQAFLDTWTWDSAAEQGLREITENQPGILTVQSVKVILGLEQILGKGSLLAYLISMTLRIVEIHRVLKPTGSFYLHCDTTASHYLKLILDGVFCARGGEFQNEIAWCYGSGGASKKHFSKKHDVIFFYTKSDDYSFNVDAVREPYSSPHKSMTPKVIGDKSYLKMNPLGRIPFDWWQIPILTNSAKERLGYPTQKPEALLEKIIKASSNEGDVVLDAYCGCGTTVAVAHRLQRKWIGIDITYQSISLILKRLQHSFAKDFTGNVLDKNNPNPALEINGVPKDFASAVALANKHDDRTRKEFEKWAVLTYSNNRAVINEKKGGDGGIDGMAFVDDSIDKHERLIKKVIFSVKSNQKLSPTVIRDLNGTLEREGAVMGILLSLYPADNLLKECKIWRS